jgi:phosphatidylserine decarboxylase
MISRLQYLLPRRGLSNCLGWLASRRWRWLSQGLIRLAIKFYQIDMTDSVITDLSEYQSFNDFFTRALKPSTRPIAALPQQIASPADGFVSQCGFVRHGVKMQAKGKNYSVASLLVESAWADIFADSAFYTGYLSPRDYHRVHLPVSGRLLQMTYIPGGLFSVSPKSVATVHDIYARNERVVMYFDTAFGKLAVIMIGATGVGSIETSWHGVVRNQPRSLQTWHYDQEDKTMTKGDELGLFKFGSSVIVLFETNQLQWQASSQHGAVVKMGQAIGDFLV